MPINVGIVGYGLSGSVFHAPIIERVQGLELRAIVSSNPEKVHRDYPHITVFPTLSDLLEEDDISLVVVTSPNDTHYILARQALEAGKHVVVEKPFVVHTSQADKLINLAHQQQVLLSVYHNRRWDNDFLTVCQLLKAGMLGELLTYEAHFDRYRPIIQNQWKESNDAGAGILYGLGSHLIDQALFLFGWPKSIQADLQVQRKGGIADDYFHLVLSYEHHTVILHAGSLVYTPGPRFQIHGTRGSFLKHGFDSQEGALRSGKHPGDPGWGEDREEAYGTLSATIDGLKIIGKVKTLTGSYEAFYQQLVAAIKLGKPVPVSAEDARDTIKLIERALQSYRERRTVFLSETKEDQENITK